MARSRTYLCFAAAASLASGGAAVSVSESSLRRSAHHRLGGAGAHIASENATAAAFLQATWREQRSKVVEHVGFLSFLFGREQKRVEALSPLMCGVSLQVGSEDDKWLRCPDECPVFAEHVNDGLSCDFRCVQATVAECQRMNPLEPLPDVELGACRSCIVSGCSECNYDGTDTCAKCSAGYTLNDGHCSSDFFWVWVAVFAIFGVLVSVILAWLVSLSLSPVVNSENLILGLQHRSRTKLLMPKGEGQNHSHHRQSWPLSTNLCRTEVAGPGLHLQFNFQAALIIWAATIALAWYVLVVMVDPELGTLGLHRTGTARQNCIVVAFGWRAQQRLMPYKIKFQIFVYVSSFIMAVIFGVMQLDKFHDADAEQTTHKDFCARCKGVPKDKGDAELEKELKEALASSLGTEVVNVSACWDYEDQEYELIKVLEDDLAERETARRKMHMQRKQSRSAEAGQSGMAAVSEEAEQDAEEDDSEKRDCWAFRKVEQLVFSDDQSAVLANAAGPDGESSVEERFQSVRDKLRSLECTGQAFVVFSTEAGRDAAVELSARSGGLSFRGKEQVLTLEAADCEPASMLWQNCVEKSTWWKVKKAVGGFFIYILALGFWVCAFYAPYAYILLSSNYNYGQEPSMVTSTAFTLVVVVGNLLMYNTCSLIADRLGFESVDSREVLYMLLYSAACMMNVLLDMVVTYYMAYWMLVGVHMKTWDGRHLGEVTRFTERFETYALQRSLGENLWAYSFPSTFLIPFMAEPIGTIYAPYKIMSWIVRSNKGISTWTAERLLTPMPMDLSRYADVLLNVNLVALVFYFPPGWTHWLFAAMALSHCVIYAIDHYKVLRSIPSCYFSTMDVDWWAQWMLSIPIGLIMASLVFKVNSLGYWLDLDGYLLIGVCTAACLLHIAVHTWVLSSVVPKFARDDKSSAHQEMKYRECAKKHPVSWFASNPIYCLRSKYIYKQDPPCDFVIAGKEHVLRVNAEEGYYFHDKEAEAEHYADALGSWSNFGSELKTSASRMVAEVSQHLKNKQGEPNAASEEKAADMTSDSEYSPNPTPRDPKAAPVVAVPATTPGNEAQSSAPPEQVPVFGGATQENDRDKSP